MKVFITGASSGIGEAFARYYARQYPNCELGLHGRREAALNALAQSLGVPCSLYPCDVRDLPAMQGAGEAFLASHGVPDLVIANAGVSTGTATEHSEDAEVFRAVFDTNVMGMVNTFQAFLPAMLQAKAGKLAGIASVAGFRGLPGSSVYSASKAAAITYLESLRVELRSTGVKVITLCPGYIDTPMTQRNQYPMPFLLKPEEAARRMARCIDRDARLAVVPWQMAAVSVLLRALPGAIYDRLFAKAPRKPRQTT
ncbi:MAG: SDR family oxidoreductase [Burkholderiales bacterium]